MSEKSAVQHRPEAGLSRRAQYLAIPLGAFAPAHRSQSRWRNAWLRHGSSLLTSAGLTAAAIALLLTVLPRSLTIYRDAASLHLGAITLREQPASTTAGHVLFAGDAAVLLPTDPRIGRATAAGVIDGHKVTGWCEPAAVTEDRPRERCNFTIDDGRVSSTDTFDPHSRQWTREYSDGKRAIFDVPDHATPVDVPLPLGR